MPIQGKIFHREPLVGTPLALDDYGQSPWRVAKIMANASLLFERESKDEHKRKLAQDAKCKICCHIRSLKEHYEGAINLNGEASEAAAKLARDISYCETMLDLIESQVNGLVSRQRKWRVDAASLDKRYDEEIKLRGFWNVLKRHVPWADKLIGAGAGMVVWASNGWAAITILIQYGVAQIVQNPELQKTIDDAVKLFVNLGGIFALSGVMSSVDRAAFERKQKLLNECEQKKNAIFEEEKTHRLQLFATIKEKALELCAKYGYLQELKMEDPGYASLLEKGDFAAINKIHRDRLKRIYGDTIPERLLEGAGIDSRSNSSIDEFKIAPKEA